MVKDELVIVPKAALTDILHCMEVMIKLIDINKNPTEEELDKIKYVNKVFFQAMEQYSHLQTLINKKQ